MQSVLGVLGLKAEGAGRGRLQNLPRPAGLKFKDLEVGSHQYLAFLGSAARYPADEPGTDRATRPAR